MSRPWNVKENKQQFLMITACYE